MIKGLPVASPLASPPGYPIHTPVLVLGRTAIVFGREFHELLCWVSSVGKCQLGGSDHQTSFIMTQGTLKPSPSVVGNWPSTQFSAVLIKMLFIFYSMVPSHKLGFYLGK